MNNISGFSLIEILVGAAILAFLSLGIVQITDQSIDSQTQIANEDRNYLQIEIGKEILTEDLSRLFSPFYYSAHIKKKEDRDQGQNENSSNENEVDESAPPPPSSNPQDGADGAQDSIDGVNDLDVNVEEQKAQDYSQNRRFWTETDTHHPVPIFSQPQKSTFIFMASSNRRKYANSKESSYQWIQYSLEEDAKKKGTKTNYSLMKKTLKKDIYSPEEIEWDNIKGFPILRNIVSLEFKFWDKEFKKYRELPPTTKQADPIRGIKIEFEWIDDFEVVTKDYLIVRPIWPQFEPKK